MRALGLAEYGGDEMLIVSLACGAIADALYLIHPYAALLPLVPFAIVVWFFRDPERTGPESPDVLLAPADGTVTDIVEVEEPEFIQGRALRIGIFLSPFNVHVNRVPCAGIVRHKKYVKGEFLPAYNPHAPERNESLALGLETPDGLRIVVKQITGILARRIVCETDIGNRLERGQRYGMIKFGSRTELYVPLSASAHALVAIGDRVSGGGSAFCRIGTSAAKVLIETAQDGMKG